MGAFHSWLLETQIEPAFRQHAFLSWCKVFLIPRLWDIEVGSQLTELMIFYSIHDTLDPDGSIRALSEGSQDPNLPAGYSLYDLYQPIAAPLPLAFCEREWFKDTPIDPDSGLHAVIDGFAVYATIIRVEGGVKTSSHDARMSERLDRKLERYQAQSGG